MGLPNVLDLVPQPVTIRVVDVGAMIWGDEPYEPLRAAGVARVIGFEPQPQECAKLNATHGPRGDLFLPYVVGDGSERTFHTCSYAPSSSLYEPNLALLEKFQTMPDFFRVVRREPVRTRRLDDLPEVHPTDLVKIDAQGANLDVIRGGARTLGGALVVHVEVEFVPLYVGQPLFAEVDQALRGLGFSFLKFHATAGRAFVPVVANNDPNRRISQMLWGEAVYVRDFMSLDALSPEELLKLATIVHLTYGAVDLAHLALSHYDRATGGGVADAYLRRLTGG